MTRYILAPVAARDLSEIWRFIKQEASEDTANRVQAVIREKMAFLSTMPGAGHRRHDLTLADVNFFPVYSYLIVYRPETQPLQIVSVLHGSTRRCTSPRKTASLRQRQSTSELPYFTNWMPFGRFSVL